jgi:UDPglucose 6-dehydrogenase
MNICVVGVGYVGLVTGTCFAEFGVDVALVDKDEDRIASLKDGRVPFFEPGLEELVRKNTREGRLTFTTDLGQAVNDALVLFICVGTPSSPDGEADLQYVREVAADIGRTMRGYKVVVTKSTVPVGTAELVRGIIREQLAGDIPFDVASNPEFLREGAAVEDFMRPNRVVVGTDSAQAQAILKDLYRPLYLIETPVVMTNIPTAEMIKYAANAFLATKISFINEIANLCEYYGADVHHVAKAMGLDHRIGGKFLHPGPGFGGSCFPKDTRALVRLAERRGYDLQIVRAAIEVNERQGHRMVKKIETALGGLDGRTVAVLGLTFKPNTDDIREAPALFIIRELLARGARVRAFDPVGMDNARAVLPEVVYAQDTYDAAEGADALVLVTEWNQFRNIQWDRMTGRMKGRVVLDLRNIYDPERLREKGFTYYSVGRL